MNTLELLTKAQDLIRDPAHWTQETYARDGRGNACSTTDPAATCFCSVGALYHAADHQFRFAHLAEDVLEKVVGVDIPIFNDSHTHAEVMVMWDKAKELARDHAADV